MVLSGSGRFVHPFFDSHDGSPFREKSKREKEGQIMTRRELEALGFTVKKNGRIDFKEPPKGKIFVPIPTNEEDIRNRHIDRSFIVNNRFSATKVPCIMELADETEAEGAKAYVADLKAEYKKQERGARCRLISPRSGREIMCPESISCYNGDCPKKLGAQVWTIIPASLEDMAETIKNSVYDDDPTANEAMVNVMWKQFKQELYVEKPDWVKILELDEYGYSTVEILEMLNRKRSDTSWYSNQWKAIRKRWTEYYNG